MRISSIQIQTSYIFFPSQPIPVYTQGRQVATGLVVLRCKPTDNLVTMPYCFAPGCTSGYPGVR